MVPPHVQKKRIPPGTASKAAGRDPHVALDVSGKALTDAGFAEFIGDIIESLNHHDNEHPNGVLKLDELCLKDNGLTIASLKLLSDVVVLTAADLKDLDLSGNAITVTSLEDQITWKEFLESFSGSFVLKKLDLSGNPLSAKAFEILARVYIQSELDFIDLTENETPKATDESDPHGENSLDTRMEKLTVAVGKENLKLGGGGAATSFSGKTKGSRQGKLLYPPFVG